MLVFYKSTISTAALMAGQRTPDKVEYIPTGLETPPDYWDPIVRILAGEFEKEAIMLGDSHSAL